MIGNKNENHRRVTNKSIPGEICTDKSTLICEMFIEKNDERDNSCFTLTIFSKPVYQHCPRTCNMCSRMPSIVPSFLSLESSSVVSVDFSTVYPTRFPSGAPTAIPSVSRRQHSALDQPGPVNMRNKTSSLAELYDNNPIEMKTDHKPVESCKDKSEFFCNKLVRKHVIENCNKTVMKKLVSVHCPRTCGMCTMIPNTNPSEYPSALPSFVPTLGPTVSHFPSTVFSNKTAGVIIANDRIKRETPISNLLHDSENAALFIAFGIGIAFTLLILFAIKRTSRNKSSGKKNKNINQNYSDRSKDSTHTKDSNITKDSVILSSVWSKDSAQTRDSAHSRESFQRKIDLICGDSPRSKESESKQVKGKSSPRLEKRKVNFSPLFSCVTPKSVLNVNTSATTSSPVSSPVSLPSLITVSPSPSCSGTIVWGDDEPLSISDKTLIV